MIAAVDGKTIISAWGYQWQHWSTGSMAVNKRTVQQVQIPPEVHQGVKLLAGQKADATMNEVYDQAVGWFLKSRAKKSFNYYLASTKRGKYTSMWIDTALLDRVRVIAARDAVSISRVIYTALVLYLEDKDVI